MLVTIDEYNYIFNHPTNKNEKRQKELMLVGFAIDGTGGKVYPMPLEKRELKQCMELEKIEEGMKDIDIWTIPEEFKKLKNIFHKEIRDAKKSSGVGYAGNFDAMTKEKIKDETIRKYLRG